MSEKPNTPQPSTPSDSASPGLAQVERGLSGIMTKNPLILSGPYCHENLTMFFFHGPDKMDGERYISLGEAFAKEQVRVYETGTVGQLEAENLSETFDIFVQAGDVLKGGRQDRTIGIDFIIPARSGRLPIPAFCVERGRWNRRQREDAAHFSGSTHSIHLKSMRLAAKMAHDQAGVWQGVSHSQMTLGHALNKVIHAAHSPTSYQLSVEDLDLKKRKSDFENKLRTIPENSGDVLGYAFYVNGQRNSADIYGSTKLFQKLWEKLLDVAILEAIGAGREMGKPLTKRAAQEWLKEVGHASSKEKKSAPPRTRLNVKSYKDGVVFETSDEALGDGTVLHTNIIHK